MNVKLLRRQLARILNKAKCEQTKPFWDAYTLANWFNQELIHMREVVGWSPFKVRAYRNRVICGYHTPDMLDRREHITLVLGHDEIDTTDHRLEELQYWIVSRLNDAIDWCETQGNDTAIDVRQLGGEPTADVGGPESASNCSSKAEASATLTTNQNLVRLTGKELDAWMYRENETDKERPDADQPDVIRQNPDWWVEHARSQGYTVAPTSVRDSAAYKHFVKISGRSRRKVREEQHHDDVIKQLADEQNAEERQQSALRHQRRKTRT